MYKKTKKNVGYLNDSIKNTYGKKILFQCFFLNLTQHFLKIFINFKIRDNDHDSI